jgi:mono/diheme cytochrome c family protein
MLWRFNFVLIVANLGMLLGLVPGQLAFSRPTVEEKMARRAAYWGLFADVYRANTCLAVSSDAVNCAAVAVMDASKHATKVDEAVGGDSLFFVTELANAQHLLTAKNVVDAKSRLTTLREKLIEDFASNTAPVLQPSKPLGRSLFSEYCGTCHGDGLGQPGKLTSRLRVKPVSFGRPERFSTQSPFGVYGVMIHGVDSSEMAPMLDVLSVDELWSVAFYVASLPYSNLGQATRAAVLGSATGSGSEDEVKAWIQQHSDQFALSTLAISTDAGLVQRMARLGRSCGPCTAELYILRDFWPWSGETGRLGDVAKSPRQKAESRALVLLLGSVILISAGFYIVLRRSGRVE